MRSSSGLVTFSSASSMSRAKARDCDVRVAGFSVGIEAGFEGPGESRGEVRVPHEHGFHVALAERDAGLQQIAAHGAQHQGLPPVETGGEHEPVEAVALCKAVAHGVEGLLEARSDLRRIEVASAGVCDLEVLDPQRGAGTGGDAIRALVEDAQVEVLEQRQHVGHGDRIAAPVQAQVQRPAGRIPPAQLHAHRACIGRQGLQFTDIADRIGRRDLFLVRGRERRRIAIDERGGLVRQARMQFLAQLVAPGAQRLGNAALDPRDVGGDRFALGVGAHQRLQPGQRGLRDLHLRFERDARQFVEQDAFDALAGLRVVAVARHIQQAGKEALVRVAAREQAHAAALVQVDDAAAGAQQLLHARLEQFVARMTLEHVHQRLAVVAHRRHADLVDHALHLVPQQRDLPRAGAVGGGGEQADEAALADDFAASIERLDGDVVEIGGAVHGRHGVRLGHDRKHRLARAAADLALQLSRLRLRAALAGAQQAEPGPWHGHEAIAGAAAFERIFAVAEEREVVVGQPLEELAAFRRVGARHARFAGEQAA